KNIRWFDVAMDDPFLVCVLDRVADLSEQLQPRLRGQGIAVAKISDLNTIDQFHYEIRPSTTGGAGIEDTRDIFVMHQRQLQALGLKARNVAFGIHARLDDLKRDPAANRFLLLSYKDNPATSFPDLMEQPISSDQFARLLDGGDFDSLFANQTSW